jgi:hypothetical protein
VSNPFELSETDVGWRTIQAAAFAVDVTMDGEPVSFSNRDAIRKIIPENNVLTR